MYVSYVCQALGPITPRTCANIAESAIYFNRERKLWGKKMLWNGFEPWYDPLTDHCLHLWQLWTSNWALILFTTVSVD